MSKILQPEEIDGIGHIVGIALDLLRHPDVTAGNRSASSVRNRLATA